MQYMVFLWMLWRGFVLSAGLVLPQVLWAAPVKQQIRRAAEHDAPECAAHLQQGYARCAGHEGNQRRLAVNHAVLTAKGITDIAQNRAHQGQASQYGNQRLGQTKEKHHQHTGERRDDEVHHAVPQPRDVTFIWLGMAGVLGANRRRDRRQVDTKISKRRGDRG